MPLLSKKPWVLLKVMHRGGHKDSWKWGRVWRPEASESLWRPTGVGGGERGMQDNR